MSALPTPSAVILLYPPRMTRIVLVAMLVYFAMVWIAGGPDDLAVIVNFGANFGPLVAAGEIWRLTASIFLHANLVHLLVNGYALYFLGRNVEAFFGMWGFLFLFLGSGLAGSITSAVFSEAISVGASGGIFGLLGASLVFAFRYRGVLPSRVTKVMGTMLLPWVVVNILLGVFVPRVDMNAHLGGLGGGALLALFVPPAALRRAAGTHRPDLERMLASFSLSLLFVSFAAAGSNIFRMRGQEGALLDPRVMEAVGEIDREGAIAALTEALEKNPRDASLLMARAQLYRFTQRWFETIRDYQTLLEAEPSNVGALNNLAWILLEEAPEELRNAKEADRLATKALELSPADPYVLGTYGTVRLRRGEAGEAARYLKEALETDRSAADEGTDLYLLAIALARTGPSAEAKEALRRAIRVDPSNSYRGEAEGEVAGTIQSAPSL
jgi:rhomboid protease GluP